MRGRNQMDDLNTFLLALYLILMVVTKFTRYKTQGVFLALSLITLGTFLYRYYSKDIHKRQKENRKFKDLLSKILKKSDDPYKYFKCPSCKQKVRIPKGKGKVEIVCPKCSKHFNKRT